MIVYQNKDGEYLKPGGFTRLNGGKRLSRSQLGLLKLKKVKVKEITMQNGKKYFIENLTCDKIVKKFMSLVKLNLLFDG